MLTSCINFQHLVSQLQQIESDTDKVQIPTDGLYTTKITRRTTGAKENYFLTSFKQVLYCKYHIASTSLIR